MTIEISLPSHEALMRGHNKEQLATILAEQMTETVNLKRQLDELEDCESVPFGYVVVEQAWADARERDYGELDAARGTIERLLTIIENLSKGKVEQ